MGDRPASDYNAIEDARETVASVQELERVSAAFRKALQALDNTRSGLWAGMTTDLVLRFAPDHETLARDLRAISPKGPARTKFLDPHPKVMVL